MTHNLNLYFLALIPDPKVQALIRRFKQDFADHFEAPYGSHVIPHITLINPFKLPSVLHERLMEWFTGLKIDVPSFHVKLNGFSFFSNREKPVVFAQPDHRETITDLRNVLVDQFKAVFQYPGIPVRDKYYLPHMTIAYRDLTRANFEKALKVYQNMIFETSFDVNNFCLLQHDGKQWNIIETHNLSNLSFA